MLIKYGMLPFLKILHVVVIIQWKRGRCGCRHWMGATPEWGISRKGTPLGRNGKSSLDL